MIKFGISNSRQVEHAIEEAIGRHLYGGLSNRVLTGYDKEFAEHHPKVKKTGVHSCEQSGPPNKSDLGKRIL